MVSAVTALPTRGSAKPAPSRISRAALMMPAALFGRDQQGPLQPGGVVLTKTLEFRPEPGKRFCNASRVFDLNIRMQETEKRKRHRNTMVVIGFNLCGTNRSAGKDSDPIRPLFCGNTKSVQFRDSR